MTDLGLHRQLRALPSYRVCWMLWGGLAVIDVATLLGAPPLARLAAVVVVAALCCRRAGRTVAVLVAGTAWLHVDGFVDHEYGQLGIDAPRELLQAALLLGVAALAARRTPETR